MEHTTRHAREGREELDDFWEIDDLIPRKTLPRRSADPSLVEISLEPPADAPSTTSSRPIPRRDASVVREKARSETARQSPSSHTPEAAERETEEMYHPSDSLIDTVRLRRRKGGYRYYEAFARDAARLYPVKGEACAQVPFFSYVPQYSQMSRRQLEWYLWWRENFRHEVYLNTDYSYLLLYAYEVINLSDRIDPSLARGLLFRLWRSYREIFHQLDGYLPDWICDLCLLYRLPPPPELDGEWLPVIMSHCTLKEFYPVTNGCAGYFQALLIFASNYNYRKSKFCTEENRPLFDRVIMGAVRSFCERNEGEGVPFGRVGSDRSRMTREAFSGALCAYHIKCRLDLEYTSFSYSHELKFVLTDVIKYTENRIRASLGIRARLTVYGLSAESRRELDVYLDGVLPRRRPETERTAAVPEYEALYDLPKRDFSAQLAEKIEEASWDTTKRLLEAFEEDAEEEAEPQPLPPPVLPSAPEVPDSQREGGFPHAAILSAYARGARAEAEALCRTAGLFPDAVVDSINEASIALIGDVCLEETDLGYTLIEDYRAAVEAYLAQSEGESDGI